MQKFTVGQTLETRSACDHNCIWTATVVRRTAKTVTVELDGDLITRRIYVYEDVESFKPFGSYSMAPVFRAA